MLHFVNDHLFLFLYGGSIFNEVFPPKKFPDIKVWKNVTWLEMNDCVSHECNIKVAGILKMKKSGF